MKAIRTNGTVRRIIAALVCLSATVLLEGCFPRRAPATLPAVLQAPEKQPPLPVLPNMVSELPEDLTTAQPVKVTQIRPRRIIRRTSPKNAASEATTTVDTTTAEAADDLAIGELSAGGDSNPQTQQDAKALIATSEHRLSSYSPAAARQQQGQLRKVRYFLKQAHQALNSGDAEGARTLATKAKLLLDDIAK